MESLTWCRDKVLPCGLAQAFRSHCRSKAWWYRNYGIEYGERMIFDPDYRVETHRVMRRIMAERFGAIHLGERDPQPCVSAPDWQNASTSAFAGCDVE